MMVDTQQMAELMTNIFPNGIPGKQRLEIKKIKEYMKELDIDPSNSPFETAEEFKTYLLHTRTKGIEVKDLLIKILQDIGADFDENAVKKINKREERCDVFFSVFTIFPNSAGETLPTRLTREQFAILYGTARKVDKKDDICIHEIENPDEIKTGQVCLTIANTLSVYSGCVGVVNDSGEVVAVGQLEEEQGILQLALTEGEDYDFSNSHHFILAFLPQEAAPMFTENFDPQQYDKDVYICHCCVKPDTARLDKTDTDRFQIADEPTVRPHITIDQLKDIYDRAVPVDKSDVIDVAEFAFTEKMPVTLQDDFFIKVPETLPLYMGCIGLMNCNTGHIVATGYLEYNQNQLHLLFVAKDIVYDEFTANRRFKILLFPQEADAFFQGHIAPSQYRGAIYEVECHLDYKKLKTTEKTLCIDFGTSNTTAGSYGIKDPYSNNVELVKFLDVTEEDAVLKEMVPTIVYVASCADPENVEYICGYEAEEKIIEADYNTQASVFYEIKRWITDINEREEIYDENGNKCDVSRKEILRAYIQYVIDAAEQYFKVKFKAIHFSAPVKLKSTFNNEMKSLFKNQYDVLREKSSLDEGVAIIYNHIAQQLYKNSMSEDEEKIMILDCGGGTTDLARCTYHYSPTNSYKVINVATSFENGDSNFGGNNITYRILQILKIKLAHYIKAKRENAGIDPNVSVQDLIQNDENEIMTRIDSGEPKQAIYENFEKAYAEAEQYIPTKFAESKLMKEKRKIKRNYYYLWQMAEAIKIEFYRINLVVLDFNKDKDRKICAQKTDQYYLFIHDDASDDLIKYDNPMQDIDITINEIRRVLCPDIYALLNTLFGKQGTDELMDCSFYKLSGQSCKISLFHELFKEFIPGKYLRAAKGIAKDNSADLKLACIKGSIEYMRDKEIGEIKPNISVQMPKLIYDVYRVGSTGEEKILGTDRNCRLIELPNTAKKVDFVVRDSNGKLQKQFTYVLNLYFDNKRELADITQHVQDTADVEEDRLKIQIINELRNGSADKSMYIFLLPAKHGYGVNIYQVNKSQGDYYLQEDGRFESFEGETLETFFNGKR